MFKRIVAALTVGLLAASVASARDVVVTPGAPAEVGMSEEVLRAGVALYREAVEADELKGAVLLVARRGKVVLHEAVGWRYQEKELPMEKDTLFRMASNTKPVVATAVLMLAEEEKLGLEDFVRQHLPAWNNYRAGNIRVRHLLTHTSGLRIPTIFIRPFAEASEKNPDAPSLRAEVDRFGEVGAEVTPGTSYSYSNPGFNTLGGLIEIVSEMTLAQFLRDRIYEPLGMNDSWNYESDAPAERMARVYRREDGEWKVSWTPGDGPDFPMVRASGGMISTALDYAAFCQMYLNGGSYAGKRLLRQETVRVGTTIQSRSDFTGETLGTGYGFGWAVSPEGIFSHGGSDGTYAWIDSERELIGLIFTQSPGGRLMPDRFRKLVEASVEEEGE